MKLFFGKSVGLLKPYLYFIWSAVAYYYICAGGMNFDIFSARYGACNAAACGIERTPYNILIYVDSVSFRSILNRKDDFVSFIELLVS